MLWDIIPLFICRNIIAYLSLGKSDELFDDIIVDIIRLNLTHIIYIKDEKSLKGT